MIAEAARRGLYTALVSSIGEEPAETLMAALPTYEPTDVLTKADLQLHLAPIVTALEDLKTQVTTLTTDMNQRFETLDHRLSSRIDRVWITLGSGLIVIIGALSTNLFT